MTVGEVHTLHTAHPRICAEDWRSPLVLRLLGTNKYADGDKTISDSYRDRRRITKASKIKLRWNGLKEDFKKRINTYQAPILTEHATLGLSCILLQKRASLEITEVTLRGERADYWLGDKELLLESSGQQAGDLSRLHESKRKQLLDNPFEKDGYVCVANYDDGEAQLWFHKYE